MRAAKSKAKASPVKSLLTAKPAVKKPHLLPAMMAGRVLINLQRLSGRISSNKT
jgi:hypothetical protein